MRHILLGTPILILLLVVAPYAWAQGSFSVEGYQRLAQQMQEADAERERATRGSDEWREATEASIDVRDEAIDYLTGWLREGMEEGLQEFAGEARITLMQNNIALMSQLGRCDEARGVLRAVEQFVDFRSDSATEAFRLAEGQVQDCRRAPAPTARTEPTEPVPQPDPPADDGGPNTTALILLGTGGATLIGSIIYWGVLISADNEFRPYQDACRNQDDPENARFCTENRERGEKLSRRLNVGVPLNTGLTIAGLALTGTGVALLLMDKGRDDRSATFSPVVAPGFAGFSFETRF